MIKLNNASKKLLTVLLISLPLLLAGCSSKNNFKAGIYYSIPVEISCKKEQVCSSEDTSSGASIQPKTVNGTTIYEIECGNKSRSCSKEPGVKIYPK